MASITVVPWSDTLSQQKQYKASGTDKHGGYHDYFATTYDAAYKGCKEEIDRANGDD